MKRFEAVADKINSNPNIKQKFSAKCAQDRYKRLYILFDVSDKRDQLRSGVGGEVGEMDELLLMMKEAREEMEAQKGMNKIAAREID